MKDFRVALVQMDSQQNKEENLRKMEERTSEAVQHGAVLVVFPETVEYIGPDMAGHASGVPGRITERFSDMARKNGVWLHAGSITEKYEKKARNLSMLFSPEGRCVASYCKLHMFDVTVEDGPSYRESDEILPGETVCLADTDLGRLGLSICYDLRFPQLYRLMADNGAEVLIVSANFTDPTGAAHWEPLLRARAIENTCYVLACGQCGQKPAFKAHGHSMVIDPWGRILAEAGEKEEILYADISSEVLKKTRKQIPCLQNQREDLYQLWCGSVAICE